MKKFMYWLLGDKGGRIAVGSWAWLIGQPLEVGGAQTVAIAQQSLDDIAENVEKLTEAVARQYAALQQAEKLLAEMQSQAQNLDQQAVQLVQHGEDEAALTLLGELEVIETTLPQLQAQVKTAQQNFEVGKQRLVEQQRQLQQMKTQQKVSASLQKVTAALEQANALSGLSSESAVSLFETARDAIDRRSITANSQRQLQSFGQEAQRKTHQLKAADRLAALKNQVNPQLTGDNHA
ncbi:PspA/IM30 family protein [Sphaerothrix gracilis]|uniref:PspA/IM30 family protein n=1 Tax=Sphaerothrix gracilis TaxID=3151835 RepID=UPI0031FBDBE3